MSVPASSSLSHVVVEGNEEEEEYVETPGCSKIVVSVVFATIPLGTALQSPSNVMIIGSDASSKEGASATLCSEGCEIISHTRDCCFCDAGNFGGGGRIMVVD